MHEKIFGAHADKLIKVNSFEEFAHCVFSYFSERSICKCKGGGLKVYFSEGPL